MREAALESIVHAFVAAALVRALARAWGVESPAQRGYLRRIALLVAPALPFVFAALAPERRGEPFRERLALLDLGRFDDLRIGGRDGGDWLIAAAGALALFLLLRDLLPPLVERFRGAARPGARPEAESRDLARRVESLAARMGIAAPAVVVLDSAEPALACRGLLRPRIEVTRGAVDRIEPAELDAALAHELAHAARRDPLRSVGLLALRLVFFWNPAVQVGARSAAAGMEREADDRAAALVGAEPVASALARLSGESGDGEPTLVALLAKHARSGLLESRRRRLEASHAPAVLGRMELRTTLAFATVAGVCFLVV